MCGPRQWRTSAIIGAEHFADLVLWVTGDKEDEAVLWELSRKLGKGFNDFSLSWESLHSSRLSTITSLGEGFFASLGVFASM